MPLRKKCSPTAGHSLDVCSSCHANATCDDKPNGSGKICNCKYGFVGDGRTFCQDKDECRIDLMKICGQHTTCHNTYGSYYCTCLFGYRPSNNMATFIPNDGTNCQDIDECEIEGVCGEGTVCKNLEGGFECYCQMGYKIHEGVVPFHPHRDKATCKEVDCGLPPVRLYSQMVWDSRSKLGSEVLYRCDFGYRNVERRSVFYCNATGQWDVPPVFCQEIHCGSPVDKAFAKTLWDGTARVGSVVYYECNEGYYTHSLKNVSVCEDNGVWEDIELICEGCINIKYCLNVLKCFFTFTERKPPINHLHVLNERCLHWKAEKYKGATEDYKIIFTGLRNYQTSFLDKRRHMLSSKADRVEVCLNLLPVTNYSISITAKSAKFTATVFTNTSLTVPPAPVVRYREFDTPVPTLTFQRSPSTLDPISVYQIFVLPVDGLMVFDCSSPKLSTDQYHTHYITAQIQVKDVGTEMSFTVGDGRFYHGFLNAPLENGREYYIILRSVSDVFSVCCCCGWTGRFSLFRRIQLFWVRRL
uniref:Sushi domain containing 1 n=1 Tax=Periophthalmus magnuspinnatus TaxID=409849 RepID=A0A3B3ZL94_9GOBI